MAGKMHGSISTSPVTDEVQEIVQSLKDRIEEESKRKVEFLHALLHCSQVVAGMNYFVKVVFVAGNAAECIHIRVFKPVAGEKPSLVKFETNKKVSDEITSFG
ncbi:cystatin-A-like isoform X1 [Cetorhinus maximus]